MIDLSGLQVAGPIFEPLNQPFWDGAENGLLKVQRCDSCEKHIFYPRPICPHCWNDALEWVTASGRGRLKSFSEIWKPGHPGWVPATPYLVGLVELDEGPTLLSYILAEGNHVQVGDRLVLAPLNIGGRVLPCFRKEDVMKATKDGWAGVIKGRPELGQAAERSRITSMGDIQAFTNMTGDRNPVHYDEALAKKTSFGKLIVQGGVTTGILNAVVAEDLPGPGTVFLNTNLDFRKAVGVGETITGRVEIESVRSDKPICKLKVRVTDSAGDICVEGVATTYTMPLEGL